MIRTVACALAAASLCAAHVALEAPAPAQDYPTRPIRISCKPRPAG